MFETEDLSSSDAVDLAPHVRAKQSGYHQRCGECREEPVAGNPEIVRDRIGQDGRQIVARSPREGLRGAERRDHPKPSPIHQEQPQPGLPAAFADASTAQRASTSAGAGPPQHPDEALPSTQPRVQTPVSGSCSHRQSMFPTCLSPNGGKVGPLFGAPLGIWSGSNADVERYPQSH